MPVMVARHWTLSLHFADLSPGLSERLESSNVEYLDREPAAYIPLLLRRTTVTGLVSSVFLSKSVPLFFVGTENQTLGLARDTEAAS